LRMSASWTSLPGGPIISCLADSMCIPSRDCPFTWDEAIASWVSTQRRRASSPLWSRGDFHNVHAYLYMRAKEGGRERETKRWGGREGEGKGKGKGK
jgi:hypothetical protein